jgi:hypothetical protein
MFSNFIWINPRDWCVMFCLFLSQFINRTFLTVLVYDKSKSRRPTMVVPNDLDVCHFIIFRPRDISQRSVTYSHSFHRGRFYYVSFNDAVNI